MRSRSWSNGFTRAWCTISLLGCGALAAQQPAAAPAAPSGKSPAVALLDASEAAQWNWAKDMGWQIILPKAGSASATGIDAQVQALAAGVQDAIANANADPAQIFLAGHAATTPAVFYAVSRMPDAWTAAIAVGGSPQPAIDSGRIFSGNFQNTPILWAGVSDADESLAGNLKKSGMNVEWRKATEMTSSAASQWLLAHKRDPIPSAVNCETSSPAFAKCFWIQVMRFDVNEKNDVLPTTLVPPTLVSMLDVGQFSYPRNDPGPGILVSALPEKYDGPLKAGDRIVELDGRPIENAALFEEMMRAVTETRDAVIMVQRAGARQRVDTRVIAPKKPNVVSARVEGKFDAEEKEITLISRAVAEVRVTIPQHWVPATFNWNGLPLDQLKTGGCLALHIENETLKAEKCD